MAEAHVIPMEMPEEAFIGVLASAVAADGKVVDSEIQLIELISSNHAFTRQLHPRVLGEIVARVREFVLAADPADCLDRYTNRLPAEWRGAAFLCALDLIYIDGEAHEYEERFIQRLASVFEISEDALDHFRSVFREKNGIA